MAKLDATDEECIAAAKLAGADDFITRLPEGYQTMLTGNGATFPRGSGSCCRLPGRRWPIRRS